MTRRTLEKPRKWDPVWKQSGLPVAILRMILHRNVWRYHPEIAISQYIWEHDLGLSSNDSSPSKHQKLFGISALQAEDLFRSQRPFKKKRKYRSTHDAFELVSHTSTVCFLRLDMSRATWLPTNLESGPIQRSQGRSATKWREDIRCFLVSNVGSTIQRYTRKTW